MKYCDMCKTAKACHAAGRCLVAPANELTEARRSAAACSEVVVPLLIWAELNGERFERMLTMTLPIGAGHCPGLAKAEMAKATAAILAGFAIRTGYEIDPHNA